MIRDPRLRHFSARVVEHYKAGPMAEGVRFRSAQAGQPAEVLVYDAIGSDIFGDGVTAKGILAALADADGGPVRVRVNSPGGDVFEGLAIYNAIRGYPGGAEVVVDGLAASAASIIAMAGARVSMNEGAMLMIHNAWTVAIGDRQAMTAKAATLEKIDGQLAGIYAGFSGRPAGEMAAAMDAETYYTAQEAVDAGLASEVLPAPKRPKSQARAEVSEPAVQAADPEPEPDRSPARRRLRLAESF